MVFTSLFLYWKVIQYQGASRVVKTWADRPFKSLSHKGLLSWYL